MDRREKLVERATDYALEHGLVGLSLRPLAAALGTSDRMLLYHLGSKDALVVEIIRCSTRRSVDELRSLPPSSGPGAAVHDQWRVRTGEQQTRCERLYVEASTLGLFGEEPYASKLKAAPDELVRMFKPDEIHVVVVGGEANGYWRIMGCTYQKTVSVDEWR